MIDYNLTKHLAELSKIELSENEIERITYQMQDVITLMDKVRDFNDDVDVTSDKVEEYKNLREDVSTNSSCDVGDVVVPKII